MIRRTAVALLTTLAATGCQQVPDSGARGIEGTVIAFSIKVGESEQPAIYELLSRFQQETRASVHLDQLTRYRSPLGPKVSLVTDVEAKDLADRLQSGPPIHLFAVDNVALGPLVDKHLLQPPGVDVPAQAIDNLVPEPVGGIEYFLPFRPNVRLAYARTAAFEKVGVHLPRTEEDLAAAARALRGDGWPKVTLSLAKGDPAAVTLSELIVGHGGTPLDLDGPGSVAAFTFLQRLVVDGLLAPQSFVAKWDTEVDNLLGGDVALAENWSFTSASLAAEGKLDDFTVYPGWRGPQREAHVIGGDVLGIPKGVKGKQLQAAKALAAFLMERESQELLARRNAWPSFRNDVDYGRLPAEQSSTFSAIQDALQHGWYRPAVPYWQTVTDELNAAAVAILLDRKPVEAVLEAGQRRIDAAAGLPVP